MLNFQISAGIVSGCTANPKHPASGGRTADQVCVWGDRDLLDPSCTMFITMNPGYAGRAELPDNLKVWWDSSVRKKCLSCDQNFFFTKSCYWTWTCYLQCYKKHLCGTFRGETVIFGVITRVYDQICFKVTSGKGSRSLLTSVLYVAYHSCTTIYYLSFIVIVNHLSCIFHKLVDIECLQW